MGVSHASLLAGAWKFSMQAAALSIVVGSSFVQYSLS